MEIVTERLRLREFTRNDWEGVHAYASLGSVARFMSFGPFTPDDAKRFVRNALTAARRRPRIDYVLALVLKDRDVPVGVVHLGRKSPDSVEGEVSFAIHPDHWGKGLVPEAVRAVLRFGFDNLGLHRVYAECHPDNRSSSRVMEKVGMRHEGDFRQKRWIKGAWWDISHYAILEYEFAVREGSADSSATR